MTYVLAVERLPVQLQVPGPGGGTQGAGRGIAALQGLPVGRNHSGQLVVPPDPARVRYSRERRLSPTPDAELGLVFVPPGPDADREAGTAGTGLLRQCCHGILIGAEAD